MTSSAAQLEAWSAPWTPAQAVYKGREFLSVDVQVSPAALQLRTRRFFPNGYGRDEPWLEGAYRQMSRIIGSGGMAWDVQFRHLARRADSARDGVEQTALFDAPAVAVVPHVRLARYDVGHEVVCLGVQIDYGRVDLVHERFIAQGVPRVKAGRWEAAEVDVAAVVPDGNYARVEEVLPGADLWPVGTKVSWNQERAGVLVPHSGVVVAWSDPGVARVLDPRTDAVYRLSRTELAAGSVLSGALPVEQTTGQLEAVHQAHQNLADAIGLRKRFRGR